MDWGSIIGLGRRNGGGGGSNSSEIALYGDPGQGQQIIRGSRAEKGHSHKLCNFFLLL